MNDVDPQTMTLSEIYGHPDKYFDPVTTTDNEQIRIPYRNPDTKQIEFYIVPYQGRILREYGNKIFNMKNDDDMKTHDYCSICVGKSFRWWDCYGMLGSDWTVDDKYSRRHP